MMFECLLPFARTALQPMTTLSTLRKVGCLSTHVQPSERMLLFFAVLGEVFLPKINSIQRTGPSTIQLSWQAQPGTVPSDYLTVDYQVEDETALLVSSIINTTHNTIIIKTLYLPKLVSLIS